MSPQSPSSHRLPLSPSPPALAPLHKSTKYVTVFAEYGETAEQLATIFGKLLAGVEDDNAVMSAVSDSSDNNMAPTNTDTTILIPSDSPITPTHVRSELARPGEELVYTVLQERSWRRARPGEVGINQEERDRIRDTARRANEQYEEARNRASWRY